MQLFKFKKLVKKNIEKSIKNDQNGPLIFGVIDASGSMRSAWTRVANNWNNIIKDFKNIRTITFSSEAEVLEPGTKLNLDLSVHGGGSTNILAAMKSLNQTLEKVAFNIPVVIIFISDGEDTDNGGELE